MGAERSGRGVARYVCLITWEELLECVGGRAGRGGGDNCVCLEGAEGKCVWKAESWLTSTKYVTCIPTHTTQTKQTL